MPIAFSLPKFIPLLQERINVLNPFTRTFLVSWITLLDSIPDLELVSYLPSFLGGLLRFLSDPNQDVHTATQTALERFLSEIKKIARIKRGLAESRKSQNEEGKKSSRSSIKSGRSVQSSHDVDAETETNVDDGQESLSDGTDSTTMNDRASGMTDGDWIPGQDVQVDYPKILETLVTYLSDSPGSFDLYNCGWLVRADMLQKRKSNSRAYGGSTASLRFAPKTSYFSCRASCLTSSLLWRTT